MSYNFRLDTSNIEELDEGYEQKQQEIKRAWLAITLFVLEKGTCIRFKYWPGDIASDKDVGYSGYGIKQILECNHEHTIEKDSDGQILLSIKISKQVKEMIINSMKEDHVHISPYFHIDILDKNDKLIYSSQDHGCNVLMTLHEAEMLRITSQIVNKSLFIELPETNNLNITLPQNNRD